MKARWTWAVVGAAALLGLLAVGPARAADPEYVWREAMRAVVTTNGLAVRRDTNVTTVASQYTPAYAGQLLFGGSGTGTNAVWVAKGKTTNDWVRVAP